MIRITVNPKYEFLREYIVRLPGTFENEGVEIYSGRNLIKVMTIDGLEINVKRYGIPALINRLVYSSFRMSKGKRAFTYPSTLLQKGFETPEPIAYIEERENNLIGYSYFISLQSPYKRTFYEFGDADVENCRDIVIAFARYTASLHEAGILHQDYSPGNILFDEIDGEYHFSLVDINRMRFGKVSIKEGCSNFARLWGQISFFKLLAKEYAIARGSNENICVERVLFYRKIFWLRYLRRHEVRFKLHL